MSLYWFSVIDNIRGFCAIGGSITIVLCVFLGMWNICFKGNKEEISKIPVYCLLASSLVFFCIHVFTPSKKDFAISKIIESIKEGNIKSIPPEVIEFIKEEQRKNKN